MKKFSIVVLLASVASSLAAQDVIMFRDGREKEVRIIQVNNDKTLFTESGKKNAGEEFVDNKSIYMLKYKKRGNVFFNADGQRIFSTTAQAKQPKGAILVYYKAGREDFAYELTMDEHVVTYTTGSKKSPKKVFVPKSDVFLIKYPDGTKDILADLALPGQAAPQPAAAQPQPAPAAESTAAPARQDAAPAATFPREATIITKSKKRMKVIVCEETDTQVAYKKDDSPNANIFKMAKKNIKEINYKD